METQDTYPNPMTLVASKAQQLIGALVMGAFFFLCGGLGLVQGQRDVPYWLFVAFFGVLGAFFLWFALAAKSTLTLTREGFAFKTPISAHTYQWSDIETFGWGTMNRNPTVFFKFAAHYNGPKPPLSSLAGVMAQGFEMALPGTYGMSAEAMAALLLRWKERSHAG
jgi:hypothetical protein